MLPASPFSRVWNLSPSSLEGLRREFDSALGSVAGAVRCDGRPAVSSWESESGVAIEVDVPGVLEEDLSLSIEDGVLHLTGQRRETQQEGVLKVSQHHYGEFHRAIALHDTLDPSSVTAELGNGVLTLGIARKVESQPRKIPISVRMKSDEITES